MSTIPAAELTRAHVGHHITIHPGEATGVLNGVQHSTSASTLLVAEWDGRDYRSGYYRDDDGCLTVTVGERFVQPGETSTAGPERSTDYASKIGSRFD